MLDLERDSEQQKPTWSMPKENRTDQGLQAQILEHGCLRSKPSYLLAA